LDKYAAPKEASPFTSNLALGFVTPTPNLVCTYTVFSAGKVSLTQEE
jgi:hypothetical protein